jgi:hypothetical protein
MTNKALQLGARWVYK